MQLDDLLAPYGVAATVAPGALRAVGTADFALRILLAPYAVTRVPAQPAGGSLLSRLVIALPAAAAL